MNFQRIGGRTIVRSLLASAALILSTSCSGGKNRAGSTMVVRDSSGVTIVSSSAPLWNSEEKWSISTQPVLTLGTPSDTALDQRFDVVLRALLLANDVVVVADRSNSVMYFGKDGRLLRRVGRPGEGPGEFSAIRTVLRLGIDTVVVTDTRDDVLILADTGKTVKEISNRDFPGVSHAFTDGSFLSTSAVRRTGPIEIINEGQPALAIDSFSLGVFDRSGTLIRHFGNFPSRARHPASRLLQMFGPSGYSGVVDSLFYFAYSDRPEVVLYGVDGRRRKIIRTLEVPVPVTSADRAEYKADALAKMAVQNETVFPEHAAQLDDEHGAAKTHPFFTQMALGRDGTIWLREYLKEDALFRPRPDERRISRRWRVFRSDGAWLGYITLPPFFIPSDIGKDYVLGIVADPQSVPIIQLHRLIKSD